jgi:hypothetical protein
MQDEVPRRRVLCDSLWRANAMGSTSDHWPMAARMDVLNVNDLPSDPSTRHGTMASRPAPALSRGSF